MGKLAWYKAEPQAFLTATRGMPLELKGALRLLIELIAENDGKLARDERYIAGCLGCTVRVWRRIERCLCDAGFLSAADDLVDCPLLALVYSRSSDVMAMPPNWSELRLAAVERDGEVCAYCNTTTGPFEVDHIIPRSRGGSHDLTNLAVACRGCNRRKKDKTPAEWLS